MRNTCAVLTAVVALFICSTLHAAPATQPAAKPSKEAAERADKLLASADAFTLHLDFSGDEDKPYYRLLLSVPEIKGKAESEFHQQVRITEAEAKKIINQLAADGYFDHAMGDLRAGTPAVPKGPLYTLRVSIGAKGRMDGCEEWLPFDAAMFTRLDDLRKSLDGDAAKAMNTLLDRLSGDRKAIETAEKK